MNPSITTEPMTSGRIQQMNSLIKAEPTTPGRIQQISTRIVFFIAGIGMAAWAPLVPFAKARAQIEDGMLGLLLLCVGAGSIIAMPVAGALTAKLGCRVVITASTLILSLALPFLATLSSLPGLIVSLFVFGAGVGALDVSMNVQAVIVERASGKTMMSGFHGLFSLGGIFGAAGVAMLLGAGVTPAVAIVGVLILIAIALVVSIAALLPYGSRSEGPLFAIPHGVVLLIGVVCFIVFMIEGAVLDWSAAFLSSHHGMATEHAGLGYAAFACTMTVGRLTGDWIVQRLGGVKVVLLGGICAALGLAGTLVPLWPVALIGYALVGAGCSNIVPVMFSAVGRQTVMPQNVAVPAIVTLGYAGILAGPAAIGLISHLSSLSVAFLIMTMLLIGVSGSGRLYGCKRRPMYFVLKKPEETAISQQEEVGSFGALMLPHLDAAHNLARWLLRNELDAQDVVQEAYLRAFKSFHGFHGSDGRAWLLKIVRNTAYTWLSKNRSVELATFDEEIHSPASEEDNPALTLGRSEDAGFIKEAMEDLPVEFREILVLRHLEGLSYKEIADIAQVPPGTVMSRLARARSRLKQCLADRVRKEEQR